MVKPGKKPALGSWLVTAKNNYGSRMAGRAATTSTPDRRLQTNILRLDYALGGGLRAGWIHSFYGEKSGGKTTTAYKCVARMQSLCRNCLRPAKGVKSVSPSEEALAEDPDARWEAEGQCDCFAQGLYKPDVPEFRDDKGKKLAANTNKYKEARVAWEAEMGANSYEEYVCGWLDIENSFDARYAGLQGVDCDRLLLFRPESAEMGIDILHAMACTVEIDFIVLDSIAQLTPNAEIAESTEKWQQGLQARLSNKMARLLVRDSSVVANQARTLTQIWINQTRQKIGVMFGDPTTKPGGKGQEFAVHAEIKFGKSKRETESIQYGTKDDVIHRPFKETFYFKVTKNKTRSTNGVEGYYTQRLQGTDTEPPCSLMEHEDVIKMSMHWLVRQDKKKGLYFFAEEEFKTLKSLHEHIRQPEVMEVTKQVLLETMLENVA